MRQFSPMRWSSSTPPATIRAVKDSLIVDFERHEPGPAPDGAVMDVPYYTCEYGFRLAPA